MVGIDIFTGKKYEDVVQTSHNIEVPKIVNKEYSVSFLVSLLLLQNNGMYRIQVIDISEDGSVTIVDKYNEKRTDIMLPDSDLADEIRQKFNEKLSISVTVTKATGIEGITDYTVEQKN